MSKQEQEKSLEEINKEIEEELRNYNPDDEEKKTRKKFLTIPGIILFIVIIGLAAYRILHFFF